MFEKKPIILNEKMIIAIKKHVRVRLPNQCWFWNGSRNRDNYGMMTIHEENNKMSYYAHRVTYVIEYGEFDWELQVCHNCDNPPCCNPIHLFLGDGFDNQRDSWVKGRRNHQGSNHPRVELTEDDIRKIRFKAAIGITHKELAKEYRVTRRHITDIINHRRWAHVI